MLLRYRVTGFVTYKDDDGKRAAIPVGELVEIVRAPDGGGTLTWRDRSGRIRCEELSDRLLMHYTLSHLELVPPAQGVPARMRRAARQPYRPFR
jgi:hypothetical protein